MAKYISFGLIPFVRGPLGGEVFTHWNGVPIIKKKPTRRRRRKLTPYLAKAREVLSMLQYSWRDMDFERQALWAFYNKRFTKMRTRSRDGLCWHIGNKRTPFDGYKSVNLMLVHSGFKTVDKPPLSNIGKPPYPSTDIVDCGVYEDVIKFNVWLSRSYPVDCVAQVWVKEGHGSRHPYITQIVKVSAGSKTQITIDKIKTKVRKKTVEKRFIKLDVCKVYLQFRTIAKNGEFSGVSAIYKVRVNSSKFRNRKPPQRILDFLQKYH